MNTTLNISSRVHPHRRFAAPQQKDAHSLASTNRQICRRRRQHPNHPVRTERAIPFCTLPILHTYGPPGLHYAAHASHKHCPVHHSTRHHLPPTHVYCARMAARQRTGDEESKSVGLATGSKALNPLEWTLAATDSECYFKHKTSGATRHTAPKGMPILGDDYCTVLLFVVMGCLVM